MYRFLEKTFTDIYLKRFDREDLPEPIFRGIDYSLGLRLLDDRMLAITDRDAPNRRIVEIHLRQNGKHAWVDIVPETDTPVDTWFVVGDRMFVSYTKQMKHTISIFDLSGRKLGRLPTSDDETVRMIGVLRMAMNFSLKQSLSPNRSGFSVIARKPIGRCCGRREIFGLTRQTTYIPKSGSRLKMTQKFPCTLWAAATFSLDPAAQRL